MDHVRTKLAAALLLLAPSAWGAVAIDTGNVAHFASTASSFSVSVTVGAGDNLLVLKCSQWANGQTSLFTAPPQYNSVALTKMADSYVSSMSTSFHQEIWGLLSPTVGTANITATFNDSSDGMACAFEPISGAATSGTFGTPAYYTASGSSGSATPTGATSTGIYIGIGSGSGTLTSTGSPMVNVYSVSGLSGNSHSFDYIPGTSTGAFGYSATSSNVTITAVAVLPAAGSTCTNQGWNLATGAFSTPTAGSGTFWLKSGAASSTDCSATQYWQKSGAFGAN